MADNGGDNPGPDPEPNNPGDNGNDDQNDPPNPPIIPSTAPAGEIIFTQPPSTATSYYKIAPGNMITFGWNFTYVLATPTSLTVSATCEGGNAYPVGPSDGVIPGTATEVVWDIYSYDQNNRGTPLPQARCNLVIHDERGLGVARRPGYLAPNSGLQFALYRPQSYTPLADGWDCVVCNGALSTAIHPASISLLITLVICLLSGFHLLRNANHR